MMEKITEKRRFDESVIELYDYHPPRRGEVREGVVIAVEEQGILVDIGAKYDGVVPREELDEEAAARLAVGERVAVYIVGPQDNEGNLLVSIRRAQQEMDWQRAKALLESGELWEGKVTGYNKGGLLVPFGHLDGFVPQSHLMSFPQNLSPEERAQRLADFIGEMLPLKVIEVDRGRRRLVLSHREAIHDWRREQRTRLLKQLTEGEIVHGTVTEIHDFGAFVDVGGAEGLIHISELSWHHVEHPSEVVREGQKLDVYILELDHERKRIALSLKRLQPDPWSLVGERYAPGDLIEGVVTRITNYGAFVRLEEGVEGLVHVSEMPRGTGPQEAVSPGERVLVRVLTADPEHHRISLSLRQVPSPHQERQPPQAEGGDPESVEVPMPKESAEDEFEDPVDDTAIATDTILPAPHQEAMYA